MDFYADDWVAIIDDLSYVDWSFRNVHTSSSIKISWQIFVDTAKNTLTKTFEERKKVKNSPKQKNDYQKN